MFVILCTNHKNVWKPNFDTSKTAEPSSTYNDSTFKMARQQTLANSRQIGRKEVRMGALFVNREVRRGEAEAHGAKCAGHWPLTVTSLRLRASLITVLITDASRDHSRSNVSTNKRLSYKPSGSPFQLFNYDVWNNIFTVTYSSPRIGNSVFIVLYYLLEV